MMWKLVLIAIAIIVGGESVTAQISHRRVVQVSGVVLDNANLLPIPYVNVSVKESYRGTSADGTGFFSLVTYAGDNLVFTCLGYRPIIVHIPDTVEADSYTLFQSLMQDTLELPVTVIYPWPSKDKFREAFLNLNVPDDEYEIARKNLALSELKERAKYSKMDASQNYRHYINQRVEQLYYAGQKQPNNLLNPFAWAQFLRIWNQQKGEAKRKKALEWNDYEP